MSDSGLGIDLFDSSVKASDFLTPLSENDDVFMVLEDIRRDFNPDIDSISDITFTASTDEPGYFLYNFAGILDPRPLLEKNIQKLRLEFFRYENVTRPSGTVVREPFIFSDDTIVFLLDQEYRFTSVSSPNVDNRELENAILPTTDTFHYMGNLAGTIVQRGIPRELALEDIASTTEGSELNYGNRSQDLFDENIRASTALSCPVFSFPTPMSKISMGTTVAGPVDLNSLFSKRSLFSSDSAKRFKPLINEVSLLDYKLTNSSKVKSIVKDEDLITLSKAVFSSLPNNRQPVVKLSSYRSIVRLFFKPIKINKSYGNQDFYIRLTPIFDDGTFATPEEYRINHQHQVNKVIFCPTIQPTIEILSDFPGKTILKIKRRDPANSRVLLFRQEYNTLTGEVSGEKHLASFNNGDNHIFTDSTVQNYFPNKIVYKLIQSHMGNRPGPSSSVVLNGHKTGIHGGNVKHNKCVLIAKNTAGGILIEASNIGNNVKKIRLIREEISSSGHPTLVRKIIGPLDGNSTVIVDPEDTSISFIDSTAIKNHKYRYYLVMTDKSGIEFISNEEEAVECLDISKATKNFDVVVDMSIANGRLSFDTKVNPTQLGLQFIEKAMRDNGLSYLMTPDNVSKFNTEMAVFSVSEINHSTGHRKDLGIYQPGEFKISAPSGIDKLTYEFTLCILSPDAIIPNLKSNIIDPSSAGKPGNKENSYKSNKFKSAILSRFGATPSDSRLTNSTLDTDILLGRTGMVVWKSYTPQVNRMEISDISLSKFSDDYALVEWTLNPTFPGIRLKPDHRIDYFIVCVEYEGKLATLGTVECVNFDSQLKYYFVDKNLYREVGTKSYFVIGVCSNPRFKIESERVTTVRNYSIPDEIIHHESTIVLGA